jgi:hypothetical protein
MVAGQLERGSLLMPMAALIGAALAFFAAQSRFHQSPPAS